MIRSLTAVVVGFAAPLWIHAYALSVTYPDGTKLTIETASTSGNAQASYHGEVSSEGRIWHRVVTDKQGSVIFAYDLNGSLGSMPETFHIRISPTAGPAPTVSGVRDFMHVKVSESVKIDILYNPATGERIYDVLQPSFALSAAGDAFRLEDFQIEIDGQTFSNHDGAILTGAAARIYVQGHGAYFLSLSPAPGFHQAAHVQHDRIRYELNHQKVEIRSPHHLLTKSEYRVVWIYHDPHFQDSHPGENGVSVTTADSVGMLMGN